MHGSVSLHLAEVVNDRSAFGRCLVEPRYIDTPRDAEAAFCFRVSPEVNCSIATEWRLFADDCNAGRHYDASSL